MSTKLATVGVYCASSTGAAPVFADAAAAMGRLLAEQGIRLVYGGGHVGLMGVLADAALDAGGEVHGVITLALADKEVAHQHLTSLDVVETMHQRKAAMADRADGFVMLPGGFGTLDEFFEVVTWTQLGIHAKPCGVLNVDGYYDSLAALLARANDEQFIRPQHRDLIIMESDSTPLLERMRAWTPVTTDKWLDRSER